MGNISDTSAVTRRHIKRLYFKTKKPDTAPLVVRDEALIDYLFAPEHAMCKREVDLSAFNASQTFIQKLINVGLTDVQQGVSIY